MRKIWRKSAWSPDKDCKLASWACLPCRNQSHPSPLSKSDTAFRVQSLFSVSMQPHSQRRDTWQGIHPAVHSHCHFFAVNHFPYCFGPPCPPPWLPQTNQLRSTQSLPNCHPKPLLRHRYSLLHGARVWASPRRCDTRRARAAQRGESGTESSSSCARGPLRSNARSGRDRRPTRLSQAAKRTYPAWFSRIAAPGWSRWRATHPQSSGIALCPTTRDRRCQNSPANGKSQALCSTGCPRAFREVGPRNQCRFYARVRNQPVLSCHPWSSKYLQASDLCESHPLDSMWSSHLQSAWSTFMHRIPGELLVISNMTGNLPPHTIRIWSNMRSWSSHTPKIRQYSYAWHDSTLQTLNSRTFACFTPWSYWVEWLWWLLEFSEYFLQLSLLTMMVAERHRPPPSLSWSCTSPCKHLMSLQSRVSDSEILLFSQLLLH